MVRDRGRLGHERIVVKCDVEPALFDVQAEAKRLRHKPTVLEDTGVSESRSNGVAEMLVQIESDDHPVSTPHHGLACAACFRIHLRLTGRGRRRARSSHRDLVRAGSRARRRRRPRIGPFRWTSGRSPATHTIDLFEDAH